ncbi:hypothetical protein ACFE04_016912 [Oxalis oulophora]
MSSSGRGRGRGRRGSTSSHGTSHNVVPTTTNTFQQGTMNNQSRVVDNICQYCNGHGHTARVCPSIPRSDYGPSAAPYAPSAPQQPYAYPATVGYGPSQNGHIVDTGATQNLAANLGNLSLQNKYTGAQDHVTLGGKSKILVIGATGYVGKYIVEASAKQGHTTFALVRDANPSDPEKSQLVNSFKSLGVTLLIGDLNDHTSLVNAIKQADVVISTVGRHLLLDQEKIITAIKQAGNVRRFFPSEFGNDSDRVHAVDPAKTAYANKAIIRRAIERAGIPYTIVSSNFFARYVLPNLAQPGAKVPPRDKAVIFGDGVPKAIINTEEDVASYTIKAADDPRTLNKIMYIRPAKNIYSFNDLVSLWESMIGKTLERVYIPEELVIKKIEGAPVPMNMVLSLGHSGFVKGDHTNFEIDPAIGVEASKLYPEFKYTSVEEFLSQFK